MSNDRNHDEQVSAAYQDLAKERASKHLDDKVLRMARANTERPQYSRWLAWSRPLAWAATVALCLAITLEVTQVTTPDDMATATIPAQVAAPAAMIAPELQKDKREQMSEQDMDQQLNLVDANSDSLSDSMADAISSEKLSLARSAAKQTANEPAQAGRLRQSADFSEFAEEESIEEMIAMPAMDPEEKAASELRRENESVSLGYATSHALAADMPTDECSAENRAEPESWLECIDELEASGDVEAASRQRENLIEVFPDFKLP
jgi:hypothetical protein